MPSIEEKEGIEERNADPLVDQIFNVGSAEVRVGRNVDGNLSGILNLRSGKRVVKRRVGYSGDDLVIEAATERKHKGLNFEENGSGKRTSGHVTKGQGKGKLGEVEKFNVGHVVGNLNDNAISKMVETGERIEVGGVNEKLEEKKMLMRVIIQGEGRDVEGEIEKRGKDAVVTEKLKTQNQSKEKGKEKLIDDVSVSNGKDALDLELELKSKGQELVDSLGDNVSLESERRTRNSNTRINESRMEQFRDIARKNASRFVDVEMTYVEENQKIEDWPGPFSTAMKIIRDRTKKLNSQQCPSTLKKVKSVPITWIPRNCQGSNRSRHVPDALRHRLCQLLCDCRRMNSHFFKLLVHGSPTEIRIKDCSWLTEEEFFKSRSSRSLPVLISLSLASACRLSDVGLSLLCSLLTSTSINTLADSLGPFLQELLVAKLYLNNDMKCMHQLYIDDCQSLDPMLILPALKKLEHLEVLSLAGMQTVCDGFVKEFVVACGHNMKELVFKDFIAETCPGLCALDLVNLTKLTDSALGYLANVCQEIQTLKLCHNAFSDEAIAAFVETSGELLKELSLNNVKKENAVGLIVDSCSSLVMLKLFGCGQSNPELETIGLKMSPVLEHIWVPDSPEFPLRYSSVHSSL
ncbi:hypothetical protein P3X46_019614 [Hevea brasiliensis]|uniref:FBD domain-containing protein n=1 Tax=Hevea brasiliensis TaxID=3981 RepID=A0ABQ9LNB0_HEVBR|nr:hypothetical protein P3X46_019614 [Hevea brasiliensis]